MMPVDSGTSVSPSRSTGNLRTGHICRKADSCSAFEKSTNCGVNGVPFYRLGETVTVEGSYPADELAAEIDKALH